MERNMGLEEVILVDDEEGVFVRSRAALEDAGSEAVTVENAAQGPELVRGEKT